jgi:hypothetical protein
MTASHLRIGNIVALDYEPVPQRIMVLSPGCIHLENCSVESDENCIVPVPITELFLNLTGVNYFMQIQQPEWYKLYVRSLEGLNNYFHHYKEKELNQSSEKPAPVQFYFGKTLLLNVTYVHHLQNIFFNLSKGNELFPFPFNPYPEEKNID